MIKLKPMKIKVAIANSEEGDTGRFLILQPVFNSYLKSDSASTVGISCSAENGVPIRFHSERARDITSTENMKWITSF